MSVQRAILILCCCCFTVFKCNESMSKKLEIDQTFDKAKNNISWFSVTALSDRLVFAGQSGEFVILNPGKNERLKRLTDLDLPLVVETGSGFAAIGRWNTKLYSWNSDTNEEKVLSTKLFTGRSNSLYCNNSVIYVSGVDKDTTVNANKDFVRLLPGVLYSVKLTGSCKKVDLNVDGQITHLLVSEEWITWIDDRYENRIVVKSEIKGKHYFNFNTPVISVCTDNKLIYIADSEGISVVNPVSMNKKLLHKFHKIDLQVLKLLKVDDYFYGMTSEGVYRFPDEKKVNEIKGQPADITAYNNDIIVLWQNGCLEFMNNDGKIVRDSI